MVLGRSDFRSFHKRLYAGVGCLQTVTLLKRGDDQQQGTVVAHKIFQCRWTRIWKQGQSLQGSMSSNNIRQLHIPAVELDRIGVAYINVLDRFVDSEGRTWQPESPEQIISQLLENHICVPCKRLN